MGYYMTGKNDLPSELSDKAWNHSSHVNFLRYYAEQSLSESTLLRFLDVREKVLRLIALSRPPTRLQIADIGCGAGTQSFLWAQLGHRVFGIDVNEELLKLARERSGPLADNVNFSLGSATNLPWPDESMDVCLASELLEHVPDWESCLNECKRVLKPGGVLYIATTNKLCPRQVEFNLPFYAWYPAPLKRYFEKLAKTTHPELVNYATYPAVNWFSFYSLRKALGADQYDCLDRFDNRLNINNNRLKGIILRIIGAAPPLRFIGHVFTSYTAIMAIKRA